MKILEAYDLTGSLRDAAELAGVPITPPGGMWPSVSGAGHPAGRPRGPA
jgi:hypothetical protein